MMEDIQKFIDNDKFASHLGIKVTDVAPGTARAEMEVAGHHLNSAGTVHGGAVFALADAVFSVASNSHGTLAMAINVSISFFKAISKGTLYAEAREIAINPRLATYAITVSNDSDENIAFFQGTVYRKKTAISELFQE